MWRGGLRILALWVLYAALVAWHTWPLAAHLATHRPELGPGSGFDALYSAWALAWESHALTSRGAALAAANIYHPAPDALFYGPVAFGALPFFAPVFLLTGNPTLALNLMFLGCIALSAAAVHFVAQRWTGWHSAGLVAGVAFVANRWLLATFVPRTPHIAVLCYFPFIVALAADAKLSRRGALLLGALVVAQGLTDAAYVAPAVLLPLAGLAVALLARRATRRRGALIAAAVAGAAAVLMVVHSPYRRVAARNPDLFRQTLWPAVPERIGLSLPGDLLAAVTPLAMASLVPVLILFAAALILLRSRRGGGAEVTGWRHALWWAGAGIAISLPLNVGWGDHLYRLPHLELLRSQPTVARILANPDRLRVAALCGIALLAGLAIAEIFRHARCAGDDFSARSRRGAVAMAVCAVIYAQFAWAVGQPLSYGPAALTRLQLSEAPRDSSVLRELRNAGGPTIEVPVPRRPSPQLQATAMFRSIYHWQPLLNGYGSFWPADFEARMRLASLLPDAAALQSLRRETGLSYVLVRKRDDPRLDAQRQPWLDIAARGGRPDLALVAADDDLLLFRVGD